MLDFLLLLLLRGIRFSRMFIILLVKVINP
jgi:hypothetical protein